MAGATVTMEKIEDMWSAYEQRQSANHVAVTAHVSAHTAKRYIQQGDPKRGVEPFQVRFARRQTQITRRVERRVVYSSAEAQLSTISQLHFLDELIEAACLQLKGSISAQKITLRDVSDAMRKRSQILIQLSTILTETKEISQHNEFAGRSESELIHYAEHGCFPDDSAPAVAESQGSDKAAQQGPFSMFDVPGQPEPEQSPPPSKPSPNRQHSTDTETTTEDATKPVLVDEHSHSDERTTRQGVDIDESAAITAAPGDSGDAVDTSQGSSLADDEQLEDVADSVPDCAGIDSDADAADSGGLGSDSGVGSDVGVGGEVCGIGIEAGYVDGGAERDPPAADHPSELPPFDTEPNDFDELGSPDEEHESPTDIEPSRPEPTDIEGADYLGQWARRRR